MLDVLLVEVSIGSNFFSPEDIMYEALVESLQIEARRLAKTQRNALDLLHGIEDGEGNAINFAVPIGENDRAISDIDTLTSSLVKFTEGFREDRNWSFVPRNWITEFREALKSTANSFDNLANNVSAIEKQHGGISGVDTPNFEISTTDGTEIDVKKLLSSISINIDEAYAAYYRMRPAISAPRLGEFSDLFGFFATRKNELDDLSRELNRLAQQSRNSTKTIETAAKEAEQNREKISKVIDEATTIDEDLKTTATKTAADVEAIEDTIASAKSLSDAVNEFKTDFEQFKRDLTARNADYNSKKTAFEKLKSLLDEEQSRIEQISTQADDMLKGATNAGLAASFSNKQGNIETELTKARRAYYISIGLLVFLTLPIFIYSFPREYIAEIFSHVFGFNAPQLLGRDTTQSEYQQILNFIGRAIFLVPGLMFVRFASSRHARLFRLREDYAYKYSIASSVDGFMKQAKSYADDIAAACYYELTYNPADYMDDKADDSRMMNPIFERMMTRLESRMVRKRPRKSANLDEAQATAV